MSRSTREVFFWAGLLAAYGVFLWLQERKVLGSWAENFTTSPRAIFAREHDRDKLIAQELMIGQDDTEAAPDA